MPWQIAVLIFVLLGYPTIQLISAFFARPKRKELASLLASLRADDRYSDGDLSILSWWVQTERPSLVLSWVFPVIGPAAVLYVAWELLRGEATRHLDQNLVRSDIRIERDKIAELHKTGSSKSPIFDDDRLQRANQLSNELEMLRLPITVAVTAIGVLAVIPVAVVAFGVSLSLSAKDFVAEAFRRTLLAIHSFDNTAFR
jgi:hypothetical protein